MGNIDNLFEVEMGLAINLPTGAFIVANNADIDRLAATSVGKSLGASALVALPLDASVPPEIIAKARILVLEVDPANSASLRRISQVREERQDLPIIAAIHDANVLLMRTIVRHGVADVAVLPFVEDDLITQILDASAQFNARSGNAPLAPMVTVVHSAGGGGATTVLTHLAAALAEHGVGERGVCVIDLDLQSGDVACYSGQSPRQTVATLLDARERLDGDLLSSAITDSQHGFSLIASPELITPLESADADQILELLTLVRQNFDYVLVDLPSDWTGWTLSVAMASDELMLITDLTFAGLRQAKRRIELLSSVGLERDKIRVLVNRFEHRLFKTIGMEDVRNALHCKVLATLSAEGAAMSSAQDQGLLVSDVNRKSKFAADIKALAKLLIQRGATEQ